MTRLFIAITLGLVAAFVAEGVCWLTGIEGYWEGYITGATIQCVCGAVAFFPSRR
jgi:uncharacterized membrane protein YeaQ/YmgE (transglycosylase-associated protein family)